MNVTPRHPPAPDAKWDTEAGEPGGEAGRSGVDENRSVAEMARLQALCQHLCRQLHAMGGSAGGAVEASATRASARAPVPARSGWVERQMAEKVATISDLRRQMASNRQRQERQIAIYLDEIEALRSRVVELSARFDKRAHSLSLRERHHRRFAVHTSHPLIEGLSSQHHSLGLMRDLIMNAPLFTRNNYQPVFSTRENGEYQLTEFLALHDRNFVRAAYLAVLRREPDPQGAAHYLAEVRAGESKGLILHQMLQSEEAQRFRTVIHGLPSHVRLIRWCRRPFIGRLLEGVLFFFNVGAHLRDLRALENHVIRMAEEAQLLHEANMTKLRSLTN